MLTQRQTFTELIDSGIDKSFLEKIGKMTESISFYLLYLGVSADLNLDNLKRGFYYQSDGPYTHDNWKYISVPTAVDKSLAPEKKQIIFTLVSLNKDYSEVENWDDLKADYTESTIDYLTEFVPGLRNHIEVIEAATPKTLKRYTLNSKGAAYGWAVTNDQIGSNRLPHITPLEGLYLAGHWTTPGPGISSVVSSGWKVANMILKEI